MPSFSTNCKRCPRLAAFLKQVKKSHPDYYSKPVPAFGDDAARLCIVGLAPGMHGANATGRPFTGDHADAFIGNEFIHDYLFDGTQWVIGINRFHEKLPGNQFIIRVKAFESANPEIYFEKYIDKTGCDQARVNQVQLNPEYRFSISLK